MFYFIKYLHIPQLKSVQESGCGHEFPLWPLPPMIDGPSVPSMHQFRSLMLWHLNRMDSSTYSSAQLLDSIQYMMPANKIKEFPTDELHLDPRKEKTLEIF
jgi:hypothetical protein